MVLLYHGSRYGIEGRIKAVARLGTNGKPIPQDFGAGFYCWTHKETALEWVIENYETATISMFELDDNIFRDDAYKVHKFGLDRIGTIEWALFVAYNRNWFSKPYLDRTGIKRDPKRVFPNVFRYFNHLNRADILIGPIADDKMQESFSSFMRYTLGVDALSECLKASRLGTQYVFKTQAACDILNDLCEKKIENQGIIDFLNTDLECKKKKLTITKVLANKEDNHSAMSDRVNLINRRFWNTPNQINLDQALEMLENRIKTLTVQQEISSPPQRNNNKAQRGNWEL